MPTPTFPSLTAPTIDYYDYGGTGATTIATHHYITTSSATTSVGEAFTYYDDIPIESPADIKKHKDARKLNSKVHNMIRGLLT